MLTFLPANPEAHRKFALAAIEHDLAQWHFDLKNVPQYLTDSEAIQWLMQSRSTFKHMTKNVPLSDQVGWDRVGS